MIEDSAWCLANGDDKRLRIVLSGFAGESHEELEQHSWQAVEWFRQGHLKGGMGNTNRGGGTGSQQAMERLWCSPHCLRAEEARGLFDESEDA